MGPSLGLEVACGVAEARAASPLATFSPGSGRGCEEGTVFGAGPSCFLWAAGHVGETSVPPIDHL